MLFNLRYSSLSLILLIISIFIVTVIYLPAAYAQKIRTPKVRVCKDSNRCVMAEIVATPETRSQGLMYRSKLPVDRGMLFIFPRPDFWQFWMKNVKMPLDIVWMDITGRVVFFVTEVQPCVGGQPCVDYVPAKKAFYVLELQAGVAKKWKLKIGDRLIFNVPEEILRNVR